MMEHIWVDRVEHEQLWIDHYAMQDRINADEKKIEKLREEKAYWMNVAANRAWEIGDLKACISDEIERLEHEREDLYAKIDGRNGLIETLKANLTEAEGRIRRLENALSYWKAEYREAKGRE